MTDNLTGLQALAPIIARTTGVVLCGGKGLRLGGRDKGLLHLNGQRMVQFTVGQLSQVASTVMVNANQHQDDYQAMGYRVIEDHWPDLGPLGGILSAMEVTTTRYLLIHPCDTPTITLDVSLRLLECAIANEQLTGGNVPQIFIAHDGDRMQNLHALFDLGEMEQRETMSNSLPVALADYLQTQRKVQDWYNSVHHELVDCADLAAGFFNVNTPEQLAQLQG